MARPIVAIVTVAALLAVAAPLRAQEPADYSPATESWNGLSRFFAIAAEEGIPTDTVDRLDLATLTPDDALLIICPQGPLPLEGLTAMLRAGGRVVLADDFGTGDTLLATFHIDRRLPRTEGVSSLRGNDALLVATAESTHPLAAGVDALVTNHPAALSHAELAPIFRLGDAEALVLAGLVEEGRFVALSDPSVLIDNMMVLGGNRRFAANLLHYMVDGRPGGRVRVALPGSELYGVFGEPGTDRPTHPFRVFLARLSAAELPAEALRVMALMLALVLLIIGTGALRHPSPYSRALFLLPAFAGGLAGRVAWYGGGQVSLVDPLLAYKRELETELAARLGLRASATVGDVTAALRSRGVDKARVDDARALLVELAEIAGRAEHDHGFVGPAKLADVVRRGDQLLAAVVPGRSAA